MSSDDLWVIVVLFGQWALVLGCLLLPFYLLRLYRRSQEARDLRERVTSRSRRRP